MSINLQITKGIAVVCLMIISFTVYTQEGWEWQHPTPLGAPPTNVQIIDENTIYFVAGSGIFYKTSNAGETWETSYFNTTGGAHPPEFVNPQIGFIASSDGKVFKTVDGGNTWETVYEDPDEFQFTSIDFYDENNGVVSAQKSFTDSKVLITNDGGQTWNPIGSGGSIDSIFYEGGIWEADITSPDTIYVRGGNKVPGAPPGFYRTYDGGENWDVFEISIEGDTLIPSYMEALAFVNDTVGFVSGPGGGIYKTVNGGENWKRVLSQTEGEKYYLNNMYFLNEQEGWVSGYDNDFSSFTSAPLFYTNDGGVTWVERDWVEEERFIDQITYYDNNFGIAIGRMNGNAYQTLDGGLTWEAMFGEGFRGSLNSIDATNDQNAWTVGAGGAILSTSNSGENWIIQNSNVTKTLQDVQFLDHQKGWAVGDSGTVISTVDGGANWDIIETGIDENLRNLNMINSSNGWIVGDSSLVLKTGDGGITWEPVLVFSNDTLQLNTINFFDDNIGWIGGEEGTIMFTEDGGVTWSSQETDLLGYGINDFFFLDEMKGWAACSGGTNNVFGQLIKTEDGGNTWVQVPSNFSYAFYDIHFVSPTRGWVAGYGFGGNQLLITNDGGTTWNTDTNLRTNRSINSIDFVGEGHGWAIGGSGSILKYYNLDVGTFNKPKYVVDNDQVDVFPNPSQGVVNVQISGLENYLEQAVVTLYNLEGRMMITQDTSIRNGEFTLDFNSGNVPGGLYILNVNIGNKLMTEKILIQ